MTISANSQFDIWHCALASGRTVAMSIKVLSSLLIAPAALRAVRVSVNRCIVLIVRGVRAGKKGQKMEVFLSSDCGLPNDLWTMVLATALFSRCSRAVIAWHPVSQTVFAANLLRMEAFGRQAMGIV